LAAYARQYFAMARIGGVRCHSTFDRWVVAYFSGEPTV
jgi:hypothetical protein